MLMNLFGSSSLSAAERALTGLSRRQATIASNIANIDTPGYQRKSVAFEDTLRVSLGLGGETTQDVSLRSTDPHHMADTDSGGGLGIGAPGSGDGSVRDLVASRNDNNTVSVDEEMTQLVDTQMRYQALSQSLGSRISTLRTVIRG